MIREYAEIFCWKNVSSFCSAKATHIFSAKNIRILYTESAKTVNEMALNELVKLMKLWTTGPWIVCSEPVYTFSVLSAMFKDRVVSVVTLMRLQRYPGIPDLFVFCEYFVTCRCCFLNSLTQVRLSCLLNLCKFKLEYFVFFNLLSSLIFYLL